MKTLLLTALCLAWATACLGDDNYLGKLSANPYGSGFNIQSVRNIWLGVFERQHQQPLWPVWIALFQQERDQPVRYRCTEAVRQQRQLPWQVEHQPL